MVTYSAHGLVVDSELCLSELQRIEPEQLQRSEAEPDVHLRVGDVHETPGEQVEDYDIYRVPDGHCVTVTGVGSLFSADGRELVVDPVPDANPELVRHLVLGQGFRALLYQRGYFVLHASAAVVDGQAVAFIGESGQGKSTTVSAFYAEKYSVLTDDVMAIDPDTQLVLPGFPKVKLDREAAEFLDTDLTTVEATTLERPYYATSREFRNEPIPLGGLYFLEDGAEVRVEELPASERPYRLMCASASTYQSADDEEVEPHLEDCIRLSEQVPVKRLERPRKFGALSELVRAVEADVAGTADRAASPDRDASSERGTSADDHVQGTSEHE